MSVQVQGVVVENPTQVWMQLVNTRRTVLNKAKFWNHGSWFGARSDRGPDGEYEVINTMCLANAIRFVAHGRKGEEQELSQVDQHSRVAEQLTLAAINHASEGASYDSIPEFNDVTRRRYTEILQVLDVAIEWIKPHARTYALSIAEDVMTRQERAEIDEKVRHAENDMHREWVKKNRAVLGADGRYRNGYGRFMRTPTWMKNRTPKPAQEIQQFERELKDLEKRGWEPFWAELAECSDGDKECEERVKLAALA